MKLWAIMQNGKIAVCAIAALLAVAVVGKLLKAKVVASVAFPAASLSPEVRLAHAKAALGSALAGFGSIQDNQWKARTLGSIAAVQAQAGDTAASRQSFAQALEIAQNIDNGYDSSKDWALHYIAAAQARAGDLSGGLQTAQSIKEGSLKAEALESVAAAQTRAGDLTASRQTLAQALQSVRSIDDEYQLIKDDELQHIAGAQARAGDFSGGFKTAKSIQDDLRAAYALARVGAEQAKAGHAMDSRETYTQALGAAQNIANDLLQADALEFVAVAQAGAGDAAASAQTVDLAVQSIKRDAVKPFAFERIAHAQAKAGDVNGALRTARKILNNSCKAYALASIAAAQARAGDAAASVQSFAQALDAARSIQSDGQEADTLQIIATAQAEAGDLPASRQTFSQALRIVQSEAADRPDSPPYRAMAIDTVVIAQIKADVLGAESTVRKLPPSKNRCEEYIKIAEALLTGPPASDDDCP